MKNLRFTGESAGLTRGLFNSESRLNAGKILFSGFLFVSAAHASEPGEMEHLVVTASMDPVEAVDVAGSLTVISREQIEQLQVRYLSELLRTVPGFAVSQAGGPGALTQVRVRGAEANQLLVLIDGVRANDPASGDEFQFQYALTSDIERIEIMRGPQSATWGTDALAGVVNIIRRKNLDSDSGFLKSNIEGGSFDSITAGVDGGWRSERTRFTGGVTYLESEGTNISRGDGEKDGSETTNFNGRLEFEASEALRLTLLGQHVDARNDFDGISFVTGLPEDSDQYTEANRTYLSGIATLSPLGARWNASATVNWLDSDNENFSFGAPNGSTSAETLEFKTRATIGLGANDPDDHRLTLALDYRDVEFSQRGAASAFGDPNQDQSYDVTGYAAEYIGRPTSDLTWMASVRQDDFSDFEDATTWQLGASQMLAAGIRLRGSIGTGSKAPTFIERYGFFPDFFQGNPDLKPEESQGWEVGFDVPLGDSSLNLGITYFSQDLENEINGFVFDPETFLFTAENREGESERNGVELLLSGAITSRLSISGSYTYTDATEIGPSGDSVREARRPEHMASLVLNQVFADGRGNVNLNVNYNGTQLDNYFPPPDYALVPVELDDFIVVGLAASWSLNSSWEITGRVTNLLDEDYEEILGFARPGRGVFVGIRGQFSR
jgi:vitamin B12 transporter